jgi:hypothetical protein
MSYVLFQIGFWNNSLLTRFHVFCYLTTVSAYQRISLSAYQRISVSAYLHTGYGVRWWRVTWILSQSHCLSPTASLDDLTVLTVLDTADTVYWILDAI